MLMTRPSGEEHLWVLGTWPGREEDPWGWRCGPAAKSTHGCWGQGPAVGSSCCSCRGSGVSTQLPHGGSQPPVSVPGTLTPSELHKHKVCTQYIYMHAGTHTHKVKMNKGFLKCKWSLLSTCSEKLLNTVAYFNMYVFF